MKNSLICKKSIDIIFSDNSNCLKNTGSYIESWEDDSSSPLASAVPVHEQCRIIYGANFYYYVSSSCFSTTCKLIVLNFNHY